MTNIESDSNDDYSETFSLKPKTRNELVWVSSVLFALHEMDLADIVETMDVEGFLIKEKVYTALKTTAKTKTLSNRISKLLIEEYDIEVKKEEISPLIQQILKTVKKCFLIAEESEIVIIVSSENLEDDDDEDCCCNCGKCMKDEEEQIDPKYLN